MKTSCQTLVFFSRTFYSVNSFLFCFVFCVALEVFQGAPPLPQQITKSGVGVRSALGRLYSCPCLGIFATTLKTHVLLWAGTN